MKTLVEAVSSSSAINRPLRIAIVGCGAVTEKKHLPALRDSQCLTVTALADLDEARLRRIGAAHGVTTLVRHPTEVGAHADIAIVAVPHHLHAMVAIDLMKAGLHVFVEKPLATNMADVQAMMTVAAAQKRKIGVGLVRRQYALYAFVQSVLTKGWLGAIESFDFQEGGVYNWPVATMATFRRETAGGVLFDTGAHTLDMLLSWLGDFSEVCYADDAQGGVEANCRLELLLKSGVRGVIELSRTRQLRNTCIIRGERGEIEVGVGPRGPVILRVDGKEMVATPRIVDVAEPSALDMTRLQLEQFARAIQDGTDCPLFAERTLEPIRLFDACRQQPAELTLPWEEFAAAASLPDWGGKRVLVLGGTGFIGGRLVQVLVKHTGARVRVLARDLAKLSQVSRFDVEIMPGDVTSAADLSAAMADCDLVINCTFGRGTRQAAELVNVAAVRTIIEQAAGAGIKRVVHVSTVSAYGVPLQGDLTEDSPDHAERSFVYGHTKWQGERAAFETAKRLGVDVRVLQPTVVYGPGAPSWTMNPLRMLRSGRVVLINGGVGACNAVYVDDVVLALIRAGASETGGGERFLISGPEPTTWRDFYGAYERMLGLSSTVSMTLDEVMARRGEVDRRAGNLAQALSILKDPTLFKRVGTLPLVRGVKERVPRSVVDGVKSAILGSAARKSTGRSAQPTEKSPHILAARDSMFQASTARVSIKKAERLLDYHPAHDLPSGMARTAAWAAWAKAVE